MSRGYDRHTTTFSPDGRLLQVEYAMEAINKAGPAIGLLTLDGLIIVCEKQNVTALLKQSIIISIGKTSEKIYAIDRHIFCVVSGIASDANYLIDYARQNLYFRVTCQRHLYNYRQDMPLEQLVSTLSDLKQGYTQHGGSFKILGLRPFGTSFIYAGWDKKCGFQLFTSDPSGNYSDYKALAIGNNNLAANSFLKQEYKIDLDLSKGTEIALKALLKTMDTTNPKPEQCNFYMIVEIMQISKKDDKIIGKFMNMNEIQQALDNIKVNQPEQQ